MSPSVRKFALTAHVTSSVGWIGALAVFLAHAIASMTSADAMIIRSACLAMGLTAWFVIFPLSLASLATGIVQALGTAWGLVRHYWVIAKLLLTAIATGVLLLKLAPISTLESAAAQANFVTTDFVGLRASLLVHAVGGMLILIAIAALAIYKPRGLTPYGVRAQRQRMGDLADTVTAAGVAETPGWVKGAVMIAVALLVLLALMLIVGGHGPGAHLASHA